MIYDIDSCIDVSQNRKDLVQLRYVMLGHARCL